MTVNTLLSHNHFSPHCPASDVSVETMQMYSVPMVQIWVGSSQIQSWWNETELSVDGVEMGIWPGICFCHVCLYIHEPTRACVSCLLIKQCFPSAWCRQLSFSVTIKRSRIKCCCVSIGFSHQFLQGFLTNSGVKLLPQGHPSLQPTDIGATNCAHPHVWTQA